MIAHDFLFYFFSLSFFFVLFLFSVRRDRLGDHRREDPRDHRRDNRQNGRANGPRDNRRNDRANGRPSSKISRNGHWHFLFFFLSFTRVSSINVLLTLIVFRCVRFLFLNIFAVQTVAQTNLSTHQATIAPTNLSTHTITDQTTYVYLFIYYLIIFDIVHRSIPTDF